MIGLRYNIKEKKKRIVFGCRRFLITKTKNNMNIKLVEIELESNNGELKTIYRIVAFEKDYEQSELDASIRAELVEDERYRNHFVHSVTMLPHIQL